MNPSKYHFHIRIMSSIHHVSILYGKPDLEEAKAFAKKSLTLLLPDWEQIIIDDVNRKLVKYYNRQDHGSTKG